MSIRRVSAAVLTLGLLALAPAAHAQRNAGGYTEVTGEAIYKDICQGCHMPDGMGAQGAGMYPALAGDKKLASKAYPALVIVRGQKAMPEFGTGLSDVQVAAVVNYVRTHLGNSYADTVAAEEVSPLRPRKGPVGEVKPPG